jgi:hypothetical protein
VLARFLEAQRWTAIEEGFAFGVWPDGSTEERPLAADIERLRAEGVPEAPPVSGMLLPP